MFGFLLFVLAFLCVSFLADYASGQKWVGMAGAYSAKQADDAGLKCVRESDQFLTRSGAATAWDRSHLAKRTQRCVATSARVPCANAPLKSKRQLTRTAAAYS